MAVNINQNTNKVEIVTSVSQLQINTPGSSTTVQISQPVTSTINIVAQGPQGPAGLPGTTPNLSPYSGSIIVSGGLDVTQGITGSLYGTSSWSNLSTSSSFALQSNSSSYSYTASYYRETDPVFTAVSGTFVQTSSFNSFTSSYNTGSFSGSFIGDGIGLYNIPASGITGLNLSQISSGSLSASIAPQSGLQVNTNVTATSFTGSLQGTASYSAQSLSSSYSNSSTSASYALTSSYSLVSLSASYSQNSTSASYSTNSLSSSYAETASYAPNYLPLTGGVISGNLTVIGTASFAYTTASVVEVGTNIIILSTDYPASRFGGISVVDSGSFGSSSTGSLFWDSLNNRWIYSNPSGSTYDGGMLISGPRNTSGLGNETGMIENFVAVGQGTDHIQPGTIFNSGSITQVTGSLTVTQGISGSFSGSGENLFNIPASGITGLNLSQISSGSVSASISPSNGLQINTNVTAPSFTGSLFGTASYSVTASFIDGGYY